MKKILVISAGYPPSMRYGGPVRTVHNFVRAVSPLASLWVIAPDRDLGDTRPFSGVGRNKWHKCDGVRVKYISPFPYDLIHIVFEIFRGRFDAIYVNSFLSVSKCLLPTLCALLLGTRVVIAPRGQFALSAVGMKNWKKRPYIWFWRILGLARRVTWQATGRHEADDIHRVFGNRISVEVVSNIPTRLFVEPEKSQGPELRLVFISRIARMKNLDFALACLARCPEAVRFHVYGPVEDQAYWNSCLALVRKLPGNITFEYMGALSNSSVPQVLSKYDLLFLPTRGENYGHVIVESFCAGTPVLISDRTPWRDLAVKGIGWDIPLDNVDGFLDAIHRLDAMGKSSRSELKANVYRWAQGHFDGKRELEGHLKLFGLSLTNGGKV